MKKHKSQLIIAILFLSQCMLAQKVKVEDGKETYGTNVHQGQFTTLELDKKEVTKAWDKYLKVYGKVESSKGVYKVSPANVPGSPNSILLSQINHTSTGTKVWLCMQVDSQDITIAKPNEYQTVRKILYEFGITAYRDDINEQIIEAEKALEIAVKVQEKKLNNGENLEDKLVENQNDKLDYEIRQKKNAEDFIRINNEVNTNLQEQRAALTQVEKIKAELDKQENQSSQDLHKTLNDAIKNQQQKVKEGERLAKDLEKNKSTKLELQDKLEKNALEKKLLEAELKQNKADQEAAAIDAEKMRRAVEVVKAKLQTIE
jgi:hypothetical protein